VQDTCAIYLILGHTCTAALHCTSHHTIQPRYSSLRPGQLLTHVGLSDAGQCVVHTQCHNVDFHFNRSQALMAFNCRYI